MSNEKPQKILTQAVEQVKKRNGRIVLTEIAKPTPFTVRHLGRLRETVLFLSRTATRANGKQGRSFPFVRICSTTCSAAESPIQVWFLIGSGNRATAEDSQSSRIT